MGLADWAAGEDSKAGAVGEVLGLAWAEWAEAEAGKAVPAEAAELAEASGDLADSVAWAVSEDRRAAVVSADHLAAADSADRGARFLPRGGSSQEGIQAPSPLETSGANRIRRMSRQ